MATKTPKQPDALKILSKIISKIEAQEHPTKEDTAVLLKALSMYEDFTKESKQIESLPVEISLVIPASADGIHRNREADDADVVQDDDVKSSVSDKTSNTEHPNA